MGSCDDCHVKAWRGHAAWTIAQWVSTTDGCPRFDPFRQRSEIEPVRPIQYHLFQRAHLMTMSFKIRYILAQLPFEYLVAFLQFNSRRFVIAVQDSPKLDAASDLNYPRFNIIKFDLKLMPFVSHNLLLV
jgi:hypothetical protein